MTATTIPAWYGGSSQSFSLGPNFPTYSIEVAFLSDPSSTPTIWEDIAPWARSISVRRGRSDELARVEAGTVSIVIDNADRRFDPLNTLGPYYPNVVPMRRIRIRATWASVTYPIFVGFVESWQPIWVGDTGNDAAVEIRCVDLFKSLNLFELQGPAYSQELTGTRVTNVLNTIGWPAGERIIDAGTHTCAAEALDAQTGRSPVIGSALAYMDQIAVAEGGLIFVDREGKIVFQDRRHRQDNQGSVLATFGDGSSEINYEELDADYDDSGLYNEIIVSYRPSEYHAINTFDIVSDATSQARYLKRSLSKESRSIFPGEAAAVGAGYLHASKDAALRFPRLSLDPVGAEWASILPLELSSRVTVKRRPPGSIEVISRDGHVEGITHSIIPHTWTVSLDISPAITFAEWELDVSQLGVNTYVGF